MGNRSALIIDDEPDLRELLTISLKRMKISADGAESITEAKKLLAENNYKLCLTDLRLPDGNGMNFLVEIKEKYPNLPVAIITAHGNMELAIDALRYGAFDFFIKPIAVEELRNLVKKVIPNNNDATCDEGKESFIINKLLGNSKEIIELKKKIIKLAKTDAPIIINGPSGVGKELVARLLHELSPRSKQPFIPVNCGAIPKELMESEFFGHIKGSFTGAVKDKPGLFQAANGGILFLDEIADLPLELQVKLLRAIQERKVRRIGATHEENIDVRLLGATHKNLRKLVISGEFREDLFYRINVIELQVPSLSQRISDLPLLIENILMRICNEKQIPLPVISKECLDKLYKYSFPGNVRELENILERALTLQENNTITINDLELPQVTSNLNPIANEPEQLGEYLDQKEKEKLINALNNANGSKLLAAKNLGISQRTLRYRMQKLGLNLDDHSQL
jgi:two-component system response regulator PilR (NtrC family)